VDPSGKFAYVANNGGGNVLRYTVNATTGALASAGSTAAGTNPVSVSVDPSGQFAYVANAGGTVSAYKINTNGTLTVINLAVPAGTNPSSITTTGTFQ
jgi:6-phosphogluconolactonase (cycloisomerase 2 family)